MDHLFYEQINPFVCGRKLAVTSRLLLVCEDIIIFNLDVSFSVLIIFSPSTKNNLLSFFIRDV